MAKSERLWGMRLMLYPNARQRRLIDETLDGCRFVWNKGLEWVTSQLVEGRRRPSLMEMQRQLPALKRACPWLRGCDSRALQDSLSRLETAISNHAKQPGRWGFPRFRSSRIHKNASYRTTSAKAGCIGLVKNDRFVRLPKIGDVRVRGVRRCRHARLIAITIHRRSDNRYECVLHMADVPTKRRPMLPRPIEDRCGLSIGDVVECTSTPVPDVPESFEDNVRRMRIAQHRALRCRRGSNRYERRRLARARANMKVLNQKRDWAHKVSDAIAGDSQTIYLAPVGPLRDNAIVSGKAFELRRQIEYKCAWRGCEVVRLAGEPCSADEALSRGILLEEDALIAEMEASAEAAMVHMDYEYPEPPGTSSGDQPDTNARGGTSAVGRAGEKPTTERVPANREP